MTGDQKQGIISLYQDEFFDLQSEDSLSSARVLLPEIIREFEVSSTVDVGCGIGPWLRAALDLNVETVLGIDGEYVNKTKLLIPEEFFVSSDLEKEELLDTLEVKTKFDLAISVEVAEHLAENRAPTFVRDLSKLSDLVLFSAAIPGQGGHHHINEQPPSYWARHFSEQGFDCFDVVRRAHWNEDNCAWWYLQNAFLYAKRGSKPHVILSSRHHPDLTPQMYLHPRCLTQKSQEFQAQINELLARAESSPFGRDEWIRNLEGKIDTLRTEIQKSRTVPGYLDLTRTPFSRFVARVRNAGRALRGKPFGK
ncbi:MAG: class I SAM-dependent methyltransferase [Paracoccaceae bacterium]|nr:class I SAM-dependent methyltransferase [Paracoccaceae bacterium]